MVVMANKQTEEATEVPWHVKEPLEAPCQLRWQPREAGELGQR